MDNFQRVIFLFYTILVILFIIVENDHNLLLCWNRNCCKKCVDNIFNELANDAYFCFEKLKNTLTEC